MNAYERKSHSGRRHTSCLVGRDLRVKMANLTLEFKKRENLEDVG